MDSSVLMTSVFVRPEETVSTATMEVSGDGVTPGTVGIVVVVAVVGAAVGVTRVVVVVVVGFGDGLGGPD